MMKERRDRDTEYEERREREEGRMDGRKEER